MLAQFRALAKSPVATVVLGLIALSFVVWQVGGRTNGLGGGLKAGAVVQAGSHTVDAAAFKRMFDQALQEVQQQAKQQVTSQEALAAGFDHQVAERAGDDSAFLEMVRRTGLAPSDTQVVGQLRKATAFFDPITGKFDEKTYRERLAGVGLTPKTFEQSLRDDIAQTHFVAGVVAGLRAPMIVAAVEGAYARQGRSFSFFALPPAAVGGQIAPTDAQLNQFMKDNAARLMRPELRQLSVVRFSTAAAAPGVTVDPAAVQKRFDFEKDSLSTAEKRTLVQISAKDAAAAATLSARLKGGGDPAFTAKTAGAPLLPYADAPRTGIADKRVADTAFGLKAGEVSGPIQGDLGWAVVKVLSITPGHEATLAEARPKLEQEVRQAAAKDKVYAQVAKYEDARAKGAALTAAAQQAGAAIAPVGPVTKEGGDAKNQPSGLPPKLLEAAFKLPQGGESETIDLGNGEYYAVRVDKVVAPALPPLDEIRPQLARVAALQDLIKRMQTRGEALAGAVRKGQSLEAAAGSVGAVVSRGAGVTRAVAGQTFSQQLLGRVFGAKPGEVFAAPDNKLGVVVARLDQVSPPTPGEIAPLLEQARAQAGQSMLAGIGEAVRLAARNQIKPKVDYKRAREAVGGSAAPAGPAS